MSIYTYTSEMVSALQAGAVTDYDTAVSYSEANSLSTRSVISKVKSLGLPYTPKARILKRGERVTRVELVRAIEKSLASGTDSLVGLEKSSIAALERLLVEIP
ncbi:MAG: hypothetical protein H8E12_17320 [Rhodobacteraceae bacterium]|nr:hypothetical protein [Paracoccaceae bacterium]